MGGQEEAAGQSEVAAEEAADDEGWIDDYLAGKDVDPAEETKVVPAATDQPPKAGKTGAAGKQVAAKGGQQAGRSSAAGKLGRGAKLVGGGRGSGDGGSGKSCRGAAGGSDCDEGEVFDRGLPGIEVSAEELADLEPAKKRAPDKVAPPVKVLDHKDAALLRLFETLNKPWVQDLLWQLRTSQHFRGLRLMGRPAAWESLLSTDVVADYSRALHEVGQHLDTLNAIQADGTRDQHPQLHCICSPAEV